MRALIFLLAAIASFKASAQGGVALGTLFQTPQERIALDRLRSGEAGTAVTSYGALRANPVITGYVKRSDGKHTVFVDNEPFTVKGEKAEKLLQPRNVQSYVAPPPLPVVESEPAKTPAVTKSAAEVAAAAVKPATPR